MSPVDLNAGQPPRALYTLPVISICSVSLLGFASNFVIQPILPMLILDHGGNATLVGLIIAAFSLPSVALRPLLGRLVDEWSNRLVLGCGMLVIAVAGVAYLIPSLTMIFIVRVAHGGAWAAFNTGGHAMLARLAPPGRRAEASGIYNLMPGVAQMTMPALGLILFSSFGVPGPFVACALLGLAALVIVVEGPLGSSRQAMTRAGGRRGGLMASEALLPMVLELLFSLSFTLFLIFPPVFAASLGIPVGELTLYYPIYGGTLVGVRAFSGRFLDRVPRARVVATGSVLAASGLAVAALADSVAILTIGAVLYAAAAAFTSPTLMAAVIDRAESSRLGAALATYTLGFQLAIGAGAAVWGIVIDELGYPAPYLLAIIMLLSVLAILAAFGSRLSGEHPGVPGAGTTNVSAGL